MFFRAVFHLVSRSFYAHKDTKTPLVVSIYAIGLNVLLAIFLVLPVGLGLGIAGLAIAQSVVAVVEVTVLVSIMQKRYQKLFTADLIGVFGRMLLAAAMSSALMYSLVILFPLRATDVGFFALVPKFGAIVGATLLSYVVFSFMLRLSEPRPIVDRVIRLIFRPVKID